VALCLEKGKENVVMIWTDVDMLVFWQGNMLVCRRERYRAGLDAWMKDDIVVSYIKSYIHTPSLERMQSSVLISSCLHKTVFGCEPPYLAGKYCDD
jgi:hypothetical protein